MTIPTTFNRMGINVDSGGIFGPTSGLTMYMPFTNSTTVPVIGDEFTITGNGCTLTTEDGIKCAYFNRDGGLMNTTGTYYENTNTVVSLSFWVKFIGPFVWSNDTSPFCIGNWTRCSSIEPTFIQTYFRCKINGQSNTNLFSWNDYWFHCVMTCNGGNVIKTYVNGVAKSDISAYENLKVAKVCGFGGSFTTSNSQPRDQWFNGYIAGARIYNRVLSQDEIDLLATEFSVSPYPITASDLSFSLYQKNENYTISYSIPFGYTPTFEIVEGSLPNTISFNTSTGTFSGKGLTDADHTYNLKVKISAFKCEDTVVNVTIHTYKTARISMSNQTFNFISNKAENFAISFTSDETVTFTIESGTLPAGMTFSSGRFYSAGTNTSAENKQVVVRATSANNQTGVTATMTLNMQMNAIICDNQTLKFYTGDGTKSKTVVYSGSLNAVSDAVFSMTGTLPIGVTFDATTGTFTSDGTQTVDETVTVNVTVSSSSGTSTSATAAITLEIHVGDNPVPTSGLVFYAPLIDPLATVDDIGNTQLTYQGTGISSTKYKGINCLNLSNGWIILNKNPQNFTSSTGTWSIWCNFVTSTNSNYGGIWGSNGSANGFRVTYIGQYGMIVEFTMAYGGDGRMNSPVQAVDEWHNVVFTYNGSTCAAFIDGTQVDLVSSSSTPNGSRNETLIGRWNSVGNRTCYFAAARIYDRVLDSTEIEALANEFIPTP